MVLPINGSYCHAIWTGYKIGGEHKGKIGITNGQLMFEGNVLTGGECTIDMKSITNTDIEDADKSAKLVSHLKSPDFFDVENHETATFKINKVFPYGKKGKINLIIK